MPPRDRDSVSGSALAGPACAAYSASLSGLFRILITAFLPAVIIQCARYLPELLNIITALLPDVQHPARFLRIHGPLQAPLHSAREFTFSENTGRIRRRIAFQITDSPSAFQGVRHAMMLRADLRGIANDVVGLIRPLSFHRALCVLRSVPAGSCLFEHTMLRSG